MYLFNFYLDNDKNLTNIIIGEISKENENTFGVNVDSICDSKSIAFVDRNPKIMKVIHDIRKVRNDNIVTVYDNNDMILRLEYKEDGRYLKKTVGNEKLLTNKEKIKLIKFNKSGSITCNFGDEDKTYNNMEEVVYTVSKTKSKSQKTNRFITDIEEVDSNINIALRELISNIQFGSDIGNINIKKFIYTMEYNTPQVLMNIVKDDDTKTIECLEKMILRAVEKYTIFLKF